MKTEKFEITGMTCAACQANVTRAVQKLEGVAQVDVSLLANRMTVTYDEGHTAPDGIVAAVRGVGYGAAPADAAPRAEKGFRGEWQSRQRAAQDSRDTLRRRLIASIALLLPLMYVAMGGMMGLPVPAVLSGMENIVLNAFTQLLLALAIIYINRAFYETGFRALWRRAPNMDSLVAIGSAAALAYGVFALYRMMYGVGHGQMDLVHTYAHQLYFESSAMILALVTVGKYLEARSKSKTSDALGKLVDLAPKTATVLRDGAEREIPAEQVAAGDILVIRPGGSIPADGVVTEGRGYLDQSAITGESIPVERGPGDAVISATLNKNGSFRMRATRVGEDTTLSQIIRLVDEAGNSKAPIARLADKVSGVFVPTVIGIALLTAAVWMLAGSGFEFALSRAISVLVISCPCALGLATPVAIMAGTGKAAEYGILIKSAEALETLHLVDTIVLDKTGTITSGRPVVTEIDPLLPDLDADTLLYRAAAVESGSEHPLASAIVERAAEQKQRLPAATAFEAHAGRGVSATVEGERWLAGNAAFLAENGVNPAGAAALTQRRAGAGRTPLLFARDGALAGVISVADTVRPTSRDAIRRFGEMGLRVVMLTGDNRVTAEAIRAELGIAEAISDVLPTEKEAQIRALQQRGRRVAMVGDGINDAPALVRADVGVAIGAGTDIALDSADVVLMKNSLEDVATAISLSRAVIRNVRMNLFWAFFYNVLGIPVAAGALYPAFRILLSPMLAAGAMSLSSVCVVANALRLRFFRDRGAALSDAAAQSPAPGSHTAPKKEEQPMQKVLEIQGMMCEHCRAHVRQALAAVEGVSAVEVNLAANTATVQLSADVPEAALKAAVEAAGYAVTGCRAV